MGQIFYTFTLILVSFFSFGQMKKEDKDHIVSKKLVGAWKLDYAVYTTKFTGITSKDKSKIFHTDTIYFFNDMTFKFRSHDTANKDVRTHTGNWEITDKGKVLVQKNRKAQPSFDGPSLDLAFPIKIINDNRIRIDYIVYSGQNEPKPATNNTPVFFDRIK